MSSYLVMVGREMVEIQINELAVVAANKVLEQTCSSVLIAAKLTKEEQTAFEQLFLELRVLADDIQLFGCDTAGEQATTTDWGVNTYQHESLAAGATHVGEKGHGWRHHPTTGAWQVYQFGRGWVLSIPKSQLTPLLNAMPQTCPDASKEQELINKQAREINRLRDALGRMITVHRKAYGLEGAWDEEIQAAVSLLAPKGSIHEQV